MSSMSSVSSKAFAHLHVHSEYSILDGSIRVKELVKRAKIMGHTHIALTDHGVMHGAIEFYSEAKAAKIVPILGCEIYHESLLAPHPKDGLPHHMVLLAKNIDGYKTLIRLVSSGFLRPDFSGVPIIKAQDLLTCQANGNLVALTACAKGQLGFLVQEFLRKEGSFLSLDQPKTAEQTFIQEQVQDFFSKMDHIFGPENHYVELIDNGLSFQKRFLSELVAVAKWAQRPIVATSDAHYLDQSFEDVHHISIAIKNSFTLNDIKDRIKNAQFHLPSEDEFYERYSQWPESIENTLKIAESCSNLHIPMDTYHLPKITSETGETAAQMMIKQAKEGLEERFPAISVFYAKRGGLTEEKKEEYRKRLDYELKVIEGMGFPDYFLIVSDFIIWAKKQNIPVGPGRGSGAGSLVAYALKITDLDPIPYNLIFERFLNPERVSMPDFDVDFCQWRRDEVIRYCAQKYGSHRLAQITTFGKMQAKAAVKSCGRAMDLEYSRVDRFTKLFPKDLGITLKGALEQEPRLKEEMERDEHLAVCVDHAIKLEGLVSHTSVHAAGVVISEGPMTDYLPIYTTDGKTLITQYEMKPTEKVGLVKFDFLGLKTLTVIDHAQTMIQKTKDSTFSIETIPLDDPKVYEMISTGHTVGVFQCEGGGMMKLITKLKPSTFEDIIALVALFRPGPLGSGMVDDFVERKHGRAEIVYSHPLLEPILKDTYGMILYQEQVQKIAAVLAHYTLGEADLLRRAMGKKIPEEMAKQKDRFVSGAIKNQIDAQLSEDIFELMAEFAKYGFNKSHSAAYGLISYQTAYLKTHYPEEFLAASMTCDMDNTDKIVRYVEDAKRLGFTILPPTLNEGCLDFTVPTSHTIRFALAAIKGLGSQPLEPLLAERKNHGPFSSMTDLLHRVDLGKFGKKNLSLLIQSGAIDSFGLPRSFLLEHVPHIVALSQDIVGAKQSGKRNLFSLMKKPQKNLGFLPWEEHTKKEPVYGMADLIEEKKLLGVYITEQPLVFYQKDQKTFASGSLRDIFTKSKPDVSYGRKAKKKIAVVAMLSQVTQKRTKKGSLMAYLKLEEPGFSIEALIFERALTACRIPPLDTPVYVWGDLDFPVQEQYSDSLPRLTVEQIFSLEDIRKDRVKELRVNSLTDLEDESQKDDLVTFLQKHATAEKGALLFWTFVYKEQKMTLEFPFQIELTDEFLFGLKKFNVDQFDYLT